MFGRITGTDDTSLRRTLHDTRRLPQNMNPAELAVAIRDNDRDAQRFAILNILLGTEASTNVTNELVLSALETCNPVLDITVQEEVIAALPESDRQFLQENPRIIAIIERFFTDDIQTEINFNRSLTNTQRTATSEFGDTIDLDVVETNTTRFHSALMEECSRQLNQSPFNSRDFYSSINQLHNAAIEARATEDITLDEHEQITREIRNFLLHAKAVCGFCSQ